MGLRQRLAVSLQALGIITITRGEQGRGPFGPGLAWGRNDRHQPGGERCNGAGRLITLADTARGCPSAAFLKTCLRAATTCRTDVVEHRVCLGAGFGGSLAQ